MIQSFLIALTAESSYPITEPLGRPAQAWFLEQLTRSHAALAVGWIWDNPVFCALPVFK